jgi:hypothetical protein
MVQRPRCISVEELTRTVDCAEQGEERSQLHARSACPEGQHFRRFYGFIRRVIIGGLGRLVREFTGKSREWNPGRQDVLITSTMYIETVCACAYVYIETVCMCREL